MRISVSVATYWTAVALGALTILLVVVNFAVLSSNQSVQMETNQRQQFINQSIQLKRVDDLLIRALATSAINAKDDKLRDLLTQQGVTVTPAQGESAPAAAPATPPAATGNKAP